MPFDQNAPLPGIDINYKRISNNFVVPQEQADLTTINWNTVLQNVVSLNNALPSGLKISDRATYVLVEFQAILVSANSINPRSITFSSFYDDGGVILYSAKRFQIREVVATAAGTALSISSGEIIMPIIGNNALVSTLTSLVGVGHTINNVNLLGYWDSAENI